MKKASKKDKRTRDSSASESTSSSGSDSQPDEDVKAMEATALAFGLLLCGIVC